MKVSLVYALPQKQYLEVLDVPEDTTVEQAIQMSHLLSRFPELNLAACKVGIYAKLVKLSDVLREADRIEIYRSLPRKPRNAHASEDKKERIRAKKERLADSTE